MIMAGSGVGAALHHLAHCFPSAPLPTLHPRRGDQAQGAEEKREGDSRVKESEERDLLGPEAQQSPPPSPARDREGGGADGRGRLRPFATSSLARAGSRRGDKAWWSMQRAEAGEGRLCPAPSSSQAFRQLRMEAAQMPSQPSSHSRGWS